LYSFEKFTWSKIIIIVNLYLYKKLIFMIKINNKIYYIDKFSHDLDICNNLFKVIIIWRTNLPLGLTIFKWFEKLDIIFISDMFKYTNKISIIILTRNFSIILIYNKEFLEIIITLLCLSEFSVSYELNQKSQEYAFNLSYKIFFQSHVIFDIWYLIFDIWYMIFDIYIWYLIFDIWFIKILRIYFNYIKN
jgi:hypothetical protein